MEASAPNSPWSSTPDTLTAHLAVNPDHGLNCPAVQMARERYGSNAFSPHKPRSIWLILSEQLASLVVGLLVAATALSLIMGELAEAAAIAVVILINTALGFFTELRAIRSMEALQELGRVKALVRRDGQTTMVSAEELVPGDIVILDAGDVVPADIRLLKASRLAADESALTGESIPVSKSLTAVANDAAIAERRCVLHRGTVVTRGTAEGVVYAIGLSTQVGHIAELVEKSGTEQTPLEKRLMRLSRQLIWATLAITVLIVFASVVRGSDLILSIETAIALAVAAIPEGLPIVATLALARGMWRMADRQVLISRLSAVETLGATCTILTDKTGTLTENRMAAKQVMLAKGVGFETVSVSDDEWLSKRASTRLSKLLQTIVLCNNANLNGSHEYGDPTEIALLRLSDRAGISREFLLKDWREKHQEPFDPERQMMATFHQHGEQFLEAVKGGPEAVLAVCNSLTVEDGEPVKMTDTLLQQWLTRAADMAASGLRVLAIANKQTANATTIPYENLTLLGLVGLWDPPRVDVLPAIASCHEAGVRIVMVTGDHPATARHIAKAVGIADDDRGEVVDSRQYQHITDLNEIEQARLLNAAVIARSSPEQKLELIEMHQQAGKVVAMTGDGVNDAPALKKADIGIAMGIRGTAVAKQAAAMILLDDAFASITEAIRQGRAIHSNIRRFVVYLLSCNLSEVLIVGIATVAGAPLPLTPLQILFLNLVTDVFPALALGVNAAEPQVMNRPPKPANEPILGRRHWLQIVLHGVVIATVVLVALWLSVTMFGLSGSTLTTVTFCTLSLAQIWHVLNVRNRAAGWQASTLRNPWVWGAMLLCIVIIGFAIAIVPLAKILSLEWLPINIGLIVLGLSLVPLLLGGAVERIVNWQFDKSTHETN